MSSVPLLSSINFPTVSPKTADVLHLAKANSYASKLGLCASVFNSFFHFKIMCLCVSVNGCLHVYAGICGGQTRASNSLELDGITGSFELCGCWEPNSGPFSESHLQFCQYL